jgi:hypothetical protein
MPKTIPDYSKSCIYKLLHKEDFNNENIYVGSTTNFIQRKKCHKQTCNNTNDKCYNMNLYQHIRENGGWENWCMIQIEPFSCNSKKELEARERYWIETLKSKLNCVIPTRTQREYYDNNKDVILKFRKQYYDDNKNKIAEYKKKYNHKNADKITEYHKKYYDDNKDKIKEENKKYYDENADKIKKYQKKYREINADKKKEYNKQYHKQNADKLLKEKKQYYDDNKDKIAEKGKQKINCDICGCEVRKQGLKRHKISLKCINFQKIN